MLPYPLYVRKAKSNSVTQNGAGGKCQLLVGAFVPETIKFVFAVESASIMRVNKQEIGFHDMNFHRFG